MTWKSNRWIAAGVVSALSGCAASPPVAETPVATPAPASASAPEAASAEPRAVAFVCENGERVEVRFFPAQGVAVLARGGNTSELQQEPSASGFAYRSGPIAIRGKSDALTMEIGRMKPIGCVAQ